MATLAELRSPDGQVPLVHYHSFAPVISRIVSVSTPLMVTHGLRIITAMRDFLPKKYRKSHTTDWVLVRQHHQQIVLRLVERAKSDPLFVAREFHSPKTESLGFLIRRIFPIDWMSSARSSLALGLIVPGQPGECFTAEEAVRFRSSFLSVSIDLF